MAGCGHTAEEHQEQIRAMLREREPALAAFLESDQAARIAIAAMPYEPLDQPFWKTGPGSIGFTPTPYPSIDDEEADEQDWMNEIRTRRYEETGR